MSTRHTTHNIAFSIELFDGARYQYKSHQYIFTINKSKCKTNLFATNDVQQFINHIYNHNTKQYNGQTILQNTFKNKKISLFKNMKKKTNFYNEKFSKEISTGINKFWIALNTFYQQQKSLKNKNKNKYFNFKNLTFSKVLDMTYDLLICMFSIIDMIFDIIVTHHFYINKHYIFFYCSIIILLIAQISYSAFIAIGLEPIIPPHITSYKDKFRYQQWKQYLAFIIIFPFGQLVPLLLMIQNSNKYISKQLNKFYKIC
eukprot:330508_1